MGLIEMNGGKMSSKNASIHLGEDSIWVTRHHMNWRHKTAEKLSRNNKEGLHYSSVISCSREDLAKIHESFVEIIKKTRKTVSASADEVLGHYSLDLYKLADNKQD
ncbi:hypothetical protein D3C87_1609410 [compost metagenome]